MNFKGLKCRYSEPLKTINLESLESVDLKRVREISAYVTDEHLASECSYVNELFELTKIIETISYRYGLRVFLIPECEDVWVFKVVATAEDAQRPLRDIKLYLNDYLRVDQLKTFIKSPSVFYNFFSRKLIDLEIHESKEFFKVNGVAIFDPHKETP